MMKLRLWIIITAVGLAACSANTPRIGSQNVTHLYSRSEASYATQGRNVRTVIYGDPFGGERAPFEQAVTDALERAPFVPHGADFTTQPDETARPSYRVVLAFNPVEAFPSVQLCQRQDIPAAAPGQPITVQAAFCRRGALMTSATGYVQNVQSYNDPAFRSMLSTLGYALFPPTNPDHDDRCGLLSVC